MKGGKRAQKERATRQKILTVAFDLFSKHGFKKTSISDISLSTGVNEITIYRYFGTKDNLFTAILKEVITSKYREHLIDLEPTEDIVADLTEIGVTISNYVIPNASIMRLVIMEFDSIPRDTVIFADTALIEIVNIISQYLAKAVKKGLIRKINVELVADAFFCFFYRSMTDHAFRGRDPLYRMNRSSIRNYVTLFVYGIMKDESRIQ
jgi:AcrR family transcriptional regulator